MKNKSECFLKNIKIAHRGLHNEKYKENSLSAFKNANLKGFAIEIDIHFTKDKNIIISHDDNLKRMTGIDLKINESTLNEIKQLKFIGTNEQIPTIDELLSLNLSVPILIEIKTQSKININEFLITLINKLDKYKGKYAIQSFNPFYITYFKILRPNILCGLIKQNYYSKEHLGNCWFWWIKSLFLSFDFFVNWNYVNFISYKYEDLPNKLISNFKGIKLAWTIQNENQLQYALKYVDNIIFENFIPN